MNLAVSLRSLRRALGTPVMSATDGCGSAVALLNANKSSQRFSGITHSSLPEACPPVTCLLPAIRSTQCGKRRREGDQIIKADACLIVHDAGVRVGRLLR